MAMAAGGVVERKASITNGDTRATLAHDEV